jgi:hypothetical protein
MQTLSKEAIPMAYTPNEVKQDQPMTAKAALREELYDFSLVLGDPVFRFFRKLRLCGDHLELLHRRLITVTSIAWVPLLLLDSLGSHAASTGQLSFLHDVEVQVRFLIALPVLIGAELIVHSRIRPVVHRFVERGAVFCIEGTACSRSSWRWEALSSFSFWPYWAAPDVYTQDGCSKRKGLADYGQIAQGYVYSFEEKWVRNAPASEDFLGSGDIQSLADLNSSYEIVSDMRTVPFGLEDITRLAAATAAPLCRCCSRSFLWKN